LNPTDPITRVHGIPHSQFPLAIFVYTCARHGYDRPQQHLWDEADAAALAVETRG
jgi:hypothetical protein